MKKQKYVVHQSLEISVKNPAEEVVNLLHQATYVVSYMFYLCSYVLQNLALSINAGDSNFVGKTTAVIQFIYQLSHHTFKHY